MAILIITVFFTIFISAHCSLFEATLYSARTATVEAAKDSDEKRRLATRFINLKKNIAIPIASILILNTISNTGGATLAGMYASEELGPSFVPVFSALFTLAILFLAEIMPKTLGAVHWRRFWPFIVWPLTVMNYALYPFILVSQKFSDLLTRGGKQDGVTEDEILALVRMGAREGEITYTESRLVHNIIALENMPIREIMTPRTVVFSLSADMAVEDAVRTIYGTGFTRIPVYEGDRENIRGYITAYDLFSAQIHGDPRASIGSISKPVSFVPQTQNAFALLRTSLKSRSHINIVVDEYGGIAGLVTLEDLVETILGDEIVDETDTVVDLQEKARAEAKSRPTP
ncbi:hemolysin family protein [Thermodesulfobacteriota bacterium]